MPWRKKGQVLFSSRNTAIPRPARTGPRQSGIPPFACITAGIPAGMGIPHNAVVGTWSPIFRVAEIGDNTHGLELPARGTSRLESRGNMNAPYRVWLSRTQKTDLVPAHARL